MTDQVSEIPSTSVYEFEVFDQAMIRRVIRNDSYYKGDVEYTVNGLGPRGAPATITTTRTQTSDIILKDHTHRLGNLRSVTLYDGDGHTLSETRNTYLHEDPDIRSNDQYEAKLEEAFNGQGVVHESFREERYFNTEYGEKIPLNQAKFHLLGVYSKLEKYPSVQVSVSNINYKTATSTTTTNLAFDMFSGAVTKSLTEDGYGNRFVSESVPAYHQYPGMGLAMNGGKNMLKQEGAAYTWLVDEDYETDHENPEHRIGLIRASAQTWSDEIPFVVLPGESADLERQSGIWRKKAAYGWKGDDLTLAELSASEFGLRGYYPMGRFAEFDGWTSEPSSEEWQKQGEVTLIDVHSHALEAMDINGQFAATKMDGNQEKVAATAANARYTEFTHTSLEDEPAYDAGHENGYYTDGPDLQQGVLDRNIAHSGRQSVSVAGPGSGTLSFRIDEAGKGHAYYRASVWTNSPYGQLVCKADDVNEMVFSTDPALKSGQWYLINADIPVGEQSALTVWCRSTDGPANFDDFRVHPIDAAVQAYVYNEWGELSHTIGPGNFYTEYIYDHAGRLSEVWSEVLNSEYGANMPAHFSGKVLSSKNSMHYARTSGK